MEARTKAMQVAQHMLGPGADRTEVERLATKVVPAVAAWGAVLLLGTIPALMAPARWAVHGGLYWWWMVSLYPAFTVPTPNRWSPRAAIGLFGWNVTFACIGMLLMFAIERHLDINHVPDANTALWFADSALSFSLLQAVFYAMCGVAGCYVASRVIKSVP